MIGLLAMALATQEPTLSISTISSDYLVTECAKKDGLVMDGCVGYIIGVADALQIDRKTCHNSSGAWTLQTVAVVRKYLRDHPERWDRVPVDLVKEALVQAFPCASR